MATVTYDHASLTYPNATRPSVDDLQLELQDGEFLVLVGPSGCGKSTTLRMLAGLEQVTSGSILIDGVDVTETDPKDRDIAMVFQTYALYPHMTVGDNMGFALSIAKAPKSVIAERVAQAAEMLDLTPFLDRKPKALSGGQRQRVAMGRAIVREPKVFCMDEPLSNLDAKLRVQTRSEISRLQKRLGTTTVYVTHDQVEAQTMGDRVAVLNGGVLQQVASPSELYARPANTFVAGFVGTPSMNLVPLTRDADGGVSLGELRVPLPQGAPGEVTVGFRPEHLERTTAGGFTVTADMVEDVGSDFYVYGPSSLPGTPQVSVRLDRTEAVRSGDDLRVTIDPAKVHLFDTASGVRLG